MLVNEPQASKLHVHDHVLFPRFVWSGLFKRGLVPMSLTLAVSLAHQGETPSNFAQHGVRWQGSKSRMLIITLFSRMSCTDPFLRVLVVACRFRSR